MKRLNSVSYVAPRHSYVFTVIKNEVHEVRITKVIFAVSKDEYGNPFLKALNYEVDNNAGVVLNLPMDTKFYATMENYHKSESLNSTSHDGDVVIGRSWKGGRWYFNGVEAVEFEPTDNISAFAITASSGEIIKGSVPSELYYDANDVYAYNDVPMVDIDGNKVVKKGYLSPLLFNEKQKEIMARFKAISEEMKAADIRLISIDGGMSFVNGEHIADIMNEYDSVDKSVLFNPAKEHYDHSLSLYWHGYENVCIEFKQ